MNKEHRVILVDVDSTLVDICYPWLKMYNHDYNDNLTPEDITEWYTHKFVKPECGIKIYDYLARDDFYDYVEPVGSSVYAINLLRAIGYRIIFVTSTFYANSGRKLRLLYDLGYLDIDELSPTTICKDYIECHDKSLISSDYAIDDGMHNIESFQGIPIIFERPWNRPYNGYMRTDDWMEIVEFFKKEATWRE